MKQRLPRLFHFAVVVLPVFSIVLASILMNSFTQVGSATGTGAMPPEDGPGLVSAMLMLILGLVLCAKVAATISVTRGGYAGWVWYMVELRLLGFVYGLQCVLAVFQLPLSLMGFAVLSILWGLWWLNLQVTERWSDRATRALFRVAELTHADLTVPRTKML